MAQPVPVIVQAASGFGVEAGIAKSNDSLYCVRNGGSGNLNIAPMLTVFAGTFPGIAASNDGTPGQILLGNPQQPGLYAIYLDFGPDGGVSNLSCVAFYGVGQGTLPLRWLGGADCSILQAGGVGTPSGFLQIAPEANTGQQLVVSNFSTLALGAGSYYFTALSGNANGI